MKTKTLTASVVRPAQDSARRMSQKMVADLLEWLSAERSKPREL